MAQDVSTMRMWQRRIFATVWITYFTYYFCRYNMPVAKTSLCMAYEWNAADIGAIFTALTVMYAIGQFVNGQLADRFGSRVISTVGAAGSVSMNLLVFFLVMTATDGGLLMNHLLTLLVIFWGLNGFFQAMGWSPMVRIVAFWFPLKGRGRLMGLFGTCYQFGAAFAQLLAIFLTGYFVQKLSGDWRMVFLVPAVLLAGVGVLFYLSIRNKPEDAGLPPADEKPVSKAGPTTIPGTKPQSILRNLSATLKNPNLWIVAWTFFLLDVNRYGFVNWLPAYVDVHSTVGAGLSAGFIQKAMKICIHPLAGSIGVIVCGWATDRFFQGRRAPVIALVLLCLSISSFLFVYVDVNNTLLLVLVVALVGFFTYGAHILMVGHAAIDFGHKEGSAGAAGFIDSMGYLGASLAGWGAGKLIDMFNGTDPSDLQGYRVTFLLAGACTLAGAALISTLWRHRPQQA